MKEPWQPLRLRAPRSILSAISATSVLGVLCVMRAIAAVLVRITDHQGLRLKEDVCRLADRLVQRSKMSARGVNFCSLSRIA